MFTFNYSSCVEKLTLHKPSEDVDTEEDGNADEDGGDDEDDGDGDDEQDGGEGRK